MAELDDFFAKKDKKKSKTKSKFVTADELVKNLEECTKREVAANAAKPKKPDVATAAATLTGGVAEGGENETTIKAPEPVIEPVEEEWKEFEQEQRKDYSGLKIGQLTINEKQHQQQQQQNQQQQQHHHQHSDDIYDEDEEDSDGFVNADPNGKRQGHGPWKKLIPAEEVTQIPVPVETEKSSSSSSKPYISPALRYSQAGSGIGGSGGGGLRARRAAPDITNTEFFPTLNAARPEEQRKKKNEPAFEEVRHGGRFQRVQETTAAPVAATNRFQSLDDEADS
ncbi:protein CDV3 homolog isoform X2 [Drosophila grimshawi]|uniref:GH19835 n=1 Tax=Drosophila grimshawi TaxID=7222 RepID=B4J9N0_DROGR|nr:protein CDV3 homolog isoform X2 [Drosophila grimshawi]EDW02537.1 GH19835 [Drosophila grimshawi]